MNRRRFLYSTLALGGGATLGAGLVSLRLHRAPRRDPYLTGDHLNGIKEADLPGRRVLFIGNSMVLRHDVPSRVAALARASGQEISVVMAAANGARLIESWRIAELRDLLGRMEWDAVVLQDFTETPLRATDRWGSALAIGRFAKAVAPAPILLYPPWPGDLGHGIYRNAGRFKAQPQSPEDYAGRTMAHYRDVAEDVGAEIAPVPERWLAAVAGGADLYDSDLHHSNPAGAELAARVIWEALAPLIR